MGGGNQNSTDSESAVDGSFRYENRKEVSRKTEECKEESVYWADCEREKKDLESCDSEQELPALRKCLQCRAPSKPFVRYCGKCWRERKGWVSTHERKKKRQRKTKEEKIVYRVDTDTETDSAEKDLTENKTSSQDSLDSLVTNDRTRMNSQDSGISSMESQELELSVKPEEISEKPSLNRSLSLDLKNVSKIENSLGSPASSLDSGFSSNKDESSLCLLCVTRKKDASLVHGRIGHQVKRSLGRRYQIFQLLFLRFVVIHVLRNCGGEKLSAQFVDEPLRELLNSYKLELISDSISRFATETSLQSLT